MIDSIIDCSSIRVTVVCFLWELQLNITNQESLYFVSSRFEKRNMPEIKMLIFVF